MQANPVFFDINKLLEETKAFQTPFFFIDENKIKKNLEILLDIKNRCGVKILLAQKAYSCFNTYPLIAQYLDGTTSSGLYEAMLSKKYFSLENHVFAPAFTENDIKKLIKICNHIVFNSVAQLEKHYAICKKNKLAISLRVNPELSTQSTAHSIFDPCSPFSRFGVLKNDPFFSNYDTHSLLDGLHFHTLCQQNSTALIKTYNAFEEKFGEFFSKICFYKEKKGEKATLNLGGGHHITNGHLDDGKGYNTDKLVELILRIKRRFGCEVYLEPGEAVVLNSGYLVSTVLDIVKNKKKIAILDASAACHNPDIIESNHAYTPPIYNAVNLGISDDKNSTRLCGNSCLAGDIIGDYRLASSVEVGERLVFGDMALYTIVKSNTFNGLPLPSVYIKRLNGKTEKVKAPRFNDFLKRLGNTKAGRG